MKLFELKRKGEIQADDDLVVSGMELDGDEEKWLAVIHAS